MPPARPPVPAALPADTALAAAYWRAVPRARPADIQQPGPGQESVWNYPRPPRVEEVRARVCVRAAAVAAADGGAGALLARGETALRVLETANPPAYYLPASAVQRALLAPCEGASFCEWKGAARYWRLACAAPNSAPVAWSYPAPAAGYEMLRGAFAFYPGRAACTLNGEAVRAQAGGYYGGWITRAVSGPFKGAPGSALW